MLSSEYICLQILQFLAESTIASMTFCDIYYARKLRCRSVQGMHVFVIIKNFFDTKNQSYCSLRLLCKILSIFLSILKLKFGTQNDVY